MSSQGRGPEPGTERVEALALPAVLGMAVGLALGRRLGSLAAGVAVGVLLAAAFGGLRLWLSDLPR